MSHVARPNRYAAGGRLQVFMGKVKEKRAAAPDGSGPDIEIQNADDIVEVVLAPEIFATGGRGQPHRPVVVSRAGVVAPPVERPDAAFPGKAGAPAVGSPQPAQNRQASDGGHAVAFTALHADSAAADGAFHKVRADPQQASGTSRETRKLLNKKILIFAPKMPPLFNTEF